MPFQSEKQRRYLWANEPEIARDWTDTYGSGIAKALGGRIGFYTGGQPYLPGLEPINTMNNPTWNPITNEFEYNMGNRTSATQPGLPGWDLYDKPGLPSGYPGTSGSLNKRYVSANNIMTDAQYADDMDSGIIRAYPHENFPIPPTMDMWGNRRIADEKRDYPPQSLKQKGIAKTKAGYEWLKNLAVSGVGAAVDLPLGLLRMMGGPPDTQYQTFMKDMFKGQPGYDPRDPNKDPWGKNIRSFADTYDVTDQWDKFAGSVLGQKYGLESLADPNLTDEEREALIEEMQKKGLRGYQLDRTRRLGGLNLKALGWKKQRDDMIMKKEDEARKIRKEKIAKEKVEAQKSTYSGPRTYDFDRGAFQRSGGQRPSTPSGHTDPGKGSYGPWS